MHFYVLTLFPEMIKEMTNHSIIKRAVLNNTINVTPINIRDFSENKHNQVDDKPYGGGAGMVLKPEPIYNAYNSIKKNVPSNTRVVFMTPHGKPFDQKKAIELSKETNLIFLCGHYEGIDQRIIDEIVTDEISLGDYILTGGELAALAVIDATARLIKGVLGKEESHLEESFSDGLLEHPHFTRPFIFNDKQVPDILVSGHHSNVAKWRREQSLLATYIKRKDLLNKCNLDKNDIKFIKSI